MAPPNGSSLNGTTTTTTTATPAATKSAAIPPRSRPHHTDGICDSVLDAIGDTPLIRLNRIGKVPSSGTHTAIPLHTSTTHGTSDNNNNTVVACELLVKCEFFNAGGSVKDRIARQMILDAEANGTLTPPTAHTKNHNGASPSDATTTTTTLIEPTSGNTGIGIALAAAVKGYNCIITLPEKMSKEKVDVLKALGAEILRTPTEAAFDAPDSHISVARRLRDDLDNAHILDQYANPSNPAAHYHGTAEEIIRQTDGKIDMLVAGTGTGGTIAGIAKRLKEHNPDIIIVGVDPVGSILAEPDVLNDPGRLQSYHVEGIGYDFIPQVLDRSLVDQWIKTDDKTSLLMMRKLIRDEGLLCGGSSGSAVAAALQAASTLRADQRCVIILPDSVRNYMTKALSDEWMSDQGFVDGDIISHKNYETWWASKKVYEMSINTPLTITSDVRCKDAIALLKREGFDMVPVLSDGAITGVVTEGNITTRILSGRCDPDTTVADAGVIYKTFHKFTMNSTLAQLAQALDHDPFVLIVTEQRCFNGSNSTVVTRSVVSGIVSRIDLLDFISHAREEEEGVAH